MTTDNDKNKVVPTYYIIIIIRRGENEQAHKTLWLWAVVIVPRRRPKQTIKTYDLHGGTCSSDIC